MLVTARPSCFTIVGGTAKHCVDQYMVLFRCCWVGGDTAMLGGLHARLCHAFLVLDLLLELDRTFSVQPR